MRKLLFLCLVANFFLISTNQICAQASTVSASLEWDPNPPSDGIASYKIHWGTASRTYTNSMSVGTATTAKVTGLLKDTIYYFAVTAHDAAGRSSDYSNEVFDKFNIPQPPKPAPFSIASGSFKVGPQGEVEMVVNGVPGGYCILETSYDLTNWHQLDELVFDTDEAIRVMIQAPANKKPAAKQFFRIKWEEE